MEVSDGLEHEFYFFPETPRNFIIPTDELSHTQEFVDQMIPGIMRIYGLGAFNVARRG